MSWFIDLSRRWQPERAAVVTDETTITYGELHHRIERAAGWLLAQGLETGDTIALQTPRSLSFLEVHLAALALGICTLPLNTSYQSAELRYILSDARPRLAVLLPERARDLARSSELGPILSSADLPASLKHAPSAALPVEPLGDLPAVLLYTSGTTGEPKGAVISHKNLAATVSALFQSWGFSEHDRLLHALPLFHVHGLFVAQHQALFAGATTRWLPRFDAARVLETIASEGMTVFMGVPTFYARLLSLDPSFTANLTSMRLFTSGSAPLSAVDHQRFHDRYGHVILERYGMTEIGIVLSNPLDGERRPGTVGLPLPGVRARVVDEDGRAVGTGEVGELLIAGPSVFAGYLGRPQQSAQALRGGWMHTGDLARQDSESYIEIVGRIKEMVITGGLNVYPSEVERALLEHPSVQEAAVFGLPDADLGERVVAAVVGREPQREHDLREWLRGRIAGFKIPKELISVPQLPRNAMGKVQKHLLRERWPGMETRA